MGEFGWKEILKQFLDDDRAKKMAADWDGDDYATFEQKDTKQLMVFARIRLNNADKASDFFKTYSDLLAKKYPGAKNAVKGDQFLALDSSDGRVLLRCVAKECVTAQGTDATGFAKWTQKLGWPAVSSSGQNTASRFDDVAIGRAGSQCVRCKTSNVRSSACFAFAENDRTSSKQAATRSCGSAAA
jgi:hypothetical protein